MLTTLFVLLPVVFVGGYAQRTMGRVSLVICLTLLASLAAAVTVVPLIASRLLKSRAGQANAIERFVGLFDHAVNGLWWVYRGMLRSALRWRLVTLLLSGAFVVVSFRVVTPLIGQEQMPPMDTGISIVSFTAPATTRPQAFETILNRVEAIIQQQAGVERVSSVVGSEPGALAFGAGGSTAQTATITVEMVNRFEREDSIWQIQERWRQQIHEVPGIQDLRINEFGATPSATTKAPVDLVISGSDARVLDQLADTVLKKLEGTPGLLDVRRSWYFDKVSHRITVDSALARVHGTSSRQIGREVRAAVDGVMSEKLRLERYLDIPVRVQYQERDINAPDKLGGIYVNSNHGPIPLRTVAEITEGRERPMITRENLQQTIDITGVNTGYTIGQVSEIIQTQIKDISLPRGYTIEGQGSIADIRETMQRMGGAFLTGLVLLFFLLFRDVPILLAPGDDPGADPAWRRRRVVGAAAVRHAPRHARDHGDDLSRWGADQQQRAAGRFHPPASRSRLRKGRSNHRIRPPAPAAHLDDHRFNGAGTVASGIRERRRARADEPAGGDGRHWPDRRHCLHACGDARDVFNAR